MLNQLQKKGSVKKIVLFSVLCLTFVYLNAQTEIRDVLYVRAGSNGNGKSTFAKLLCDRLNNVDGEIIKPAKLTIAMFAQHQMDDLIANETPVDHVRKLMAGEAEARIRSRVAQMGLDRERMETQAQNLSGGEKARLLLGIVSEGLFADQGLIYAPFQMSDHVRLQTRRRLFGARFNLGAKTRNIIGHRNVQSAVER